jgi:lysophospholipase L1-like esterase
MKTILCYGDSNTWGYNPADGSRFPRDVRWPGVLRQELGAGYEVIEEGLGGRTTVFDDPIYDYRNGKEYLIPCLYSHAPLDLVVIMLGTNDLQQRFGRSAADIAAGAGVLVGIALRGDAGSGGGAPRVLLVAPPPLGSLPVDDAEILEGGEAKSRRFAQQYRRVAASWGCAFLDAGEIITASDLDGVHFEASQHKKLGRAVAELVRQLLA